MCTVISFVRDTLYFGRNMDIDYDFGYKIAVTPRDYLLKTKESGTLLRHYAMIGGAAVADDYPLYAEACNEKGLCMAGLNFPFNALYKENAEKGKKSLAPYELIPYVLATCADLEEARSLLENTEITDKPFRRDLPLVPLHWIVSDKSGSIVFEQTKSGAKVYDDPLCVLTNNPPFPFHTENVRQYERLSSKNFYARVDESMFCEGMGAIGLPGDMSSYSRFVKAEYCLRNAVCGNDPREKIAQTFRMLESVAMPRGSVVTQNGREDVTTYSCVIDAERKAYFFRTYDGFACGRAVMTEKLASGESLAVYDVSGGDFFDAVCLTTRFCDDKL